MGTWIVVDASCLSRALLLRCLSDGIGITTQTISEREAEMDLTTSTRTEAEMVPEPRKPYATPQVTEYGDLVEITTIQPSGSAT
jgi:hypothetical protein